MNGTLQIPISIFYFQNNQKCEDLNNFQNIDEYLH